MSNELFTMKAQLRSAETADYLSKVDERVTYFLRGFLIQICEHFRKQLQGRYTGLREPQSEEISKNLKSVFVETKKVPKKDTSRIRAITKEIEEHHAAVLVNAVRKSAQDVDVDRTIIKVVANKLSSKQSPPEVFLLLRYGPWHMSQIPFVPKKEDATIIFVNVEKDEALKVKNKNQREKIKVTQSLSKFNIKITSRKDVYATLHGYDSLEYWVMKKEFGIDVRKFAIWKPSLKYISEEGYQKVLLKEVSLYKTLFDPTFKDYKNVEKGYKIEKEEYVNDLIGFQDRLRA
jgi:hypothetical protein